MAFDFDAVYDRINSDSAKWHRFAPDVIPMFVADMDFMSPPAVREALLARVRHGFFGYGHESGELKEVLAARLRQRYGWEVEPEAVLPMPGVIASMNMAAHAITRPGDGMLVQTPAYPPILACPANHGLRRDDAPLRQRSDGRYEVDWQAFDDAIKPDTRAFLLCNPHNPTGRMFDRNELERMAERCLRFDLLILSDEIHCDLALGGNVHFPIASLDPAVADRTLTFMAPSKTFNLPGLKASVAIIPNPTLRERFLAARRGLVGVPNILGVTAMVAAYRDGEDWLGELLDYLTANRDFLTAFVAERLPGVRVFPAEGTYLAWLDCRTLDLHGATPQTFFLDRAKVGLGDGSNFGPGGDGFVRLTFACPRPLLAEALERMATALAAARQ